MQYGDDIHLAPYCQAIFIPRWPLPAGLFIACAASAATVVSPEGAGRGHVNVAYGPVRSHIEHLLQEPLQIERDSSGRKLREVVLDTSSFCLILSLPFV